MKKRNALWFVMAVAFSVPGWAEEEREEGAVGTAPAGEVLEEGAEGAGAEGPAGIPADLLDDPHVREELAVNEFTAPSI